MSALGSGAKSVYFAQPYRIGAEGFYFTDLDDYTAKAASARDDQGFPIEEFEIQYIDGEDADLFNAIRVNQANLVDWFDILDELEGKPDGKIIACYLAQEGYCMEEVSTGWDDYSLYHGTAADYAEEFVKDCYQLPEHIVGYIDYERLGHDLVLDGTLSEIRRDLLLVGG